LEYRGTRREGDNKVNGARGTTIPGYRGPGDWGNGGLRRWRLGGALEFWGFWVSVALGSLDPRKKLALRY